MVLTPRAAAGIVVVTNRTIGRVTDDPLTALDV
jgi:hypothetical protein